MTLSSDVSYKSNKSCRSSRKKNSSSRNKSSRSEKREQPPLHGSSEAASAATSPRRTTSPRNTSLLLNSSEEQEHETLEEKRSPTSPKRQNNLRNYQRQESSKSTLSTTSSTNNNSSGMMNGGPTVAQHSPNEKLDNFLNGQHKQHPQNSQDEGDAPNSTMISSFVADDEVKVNLAMADLMAYLQVVANNANNLPLTRRDDPEIPSTICNLTAEEYARKSAAFIPSNVRVISGSFTKYGRVWDLPSSEEFNAVDGAQEPGKSYGGACCNAMLKVLYDAANEALDQAHDPTAASASLFDDDDEESALLYGSKSVDLQSQSVVGLTLGDLSHQTSLSWAELLRKMKAEIEEIEYAQAPTISTTRKFDLNTPFTLVPEHFDADAGGKKRSLLIGCNYSNVHGAELKASHDDIRSMKDYIVNVHGFSEQKGLMTVLMDDDEHKPPTHLNITEAFKALSEQAQPGDAVFVQFSGHGGRVLDEDAYDEVLVPCDFSTCGLIRDSLIFKTLLAPMRFGVTVTILLDCCDTGVALDLPYAWSTKTDRVDELAKLSLNDDFSFVRFLKVVKTMYEACTFTQLGRTVGTALDTADEDGTIGDGETLPSLETKQTSSSTLNQKGTTATQANIANILEVLTACTSPTPQAISCRTIGEEVIDKQPAAQNFIEKVLNCTMGAEEDMSDDDDDDDDDEDSYGQDLSAEPTTTFETDDGSYSYQEQRRSSRRSGRSGRRRYA